MSTQLAQARKNILTPEMRQVAESEGLSHSEILKGIKNGSLVIPYNRRRRKAVKPAGIGAGVRTKINVNLGTSLDRINLEDELKKLELALELGADAVMDLSTGGDIDAIRKMVVARSSLPVGTVPIYQAICEKIKQGKDWKDITPDDFFAVIKKQAQDGVDFITVHCGVTRETAARMNQEGRVLEVVSRGGALLLKWMEYQQRENPLYSEFDYLLEIAREYDLTLSLGDGLRPGCLADATDRAQIQETIILGELAQRAKEKDVQVIIEGPGHLPLNQIRTNVQLQKNICHGAPFYVLGPLVTDLAPGYDHISAAIGGAIAGAAGADFLCYVTPAEHLCLPRVEDVREGIIAAKIAAHAADIAKGVKGAKELDLQMARMRKELNWEAQLKLALDPEKAQRMRKESPPLKEDDVCSMCASFCAIKVKGENKIHNR